MSGRTTDEDGDAPVLPPTLPLFPLPNLVVFPRVMVPLHVFEPRYREMIEDLRRSGGRHLGMCLLRPGWESDYHGRPPVFEVGCAGTVEKLEELPDGRFNLLLRGVSRFRIREEQPGGSYRLARVEPLPDPAGEDSALDEARRRVLAAIGRAEDGPVVLVLQRPLPHETFVNTLCQALAFEPLERQSLLDCDGLRARYERLLEIMEFRQLEKRVPAGSTRFH